MTAHCVFFAKFAPPQSEPIEVAYSGGKDSDTILQLVREAGIPYRAIYKNTTIDPPGTIRHAREMGAEIIRPKQTFFQIVEQHGYMSRFRRTCCQILKEYKVLDKSVIGVRRDESQARKNRYKEPTRCLYYGKKQTPENHVEAVYPILDWTNQDVAEFLADRGIKCAPVYYDEQGRFHAERRLGCMACPLSSPKKRLETLKKYPYMVKALVKAGKRYRELHPHHKTVQIYADEYEYFYRNYCCNSQEDFDKVSNGLFGRPDYKQMLEDFFGIDLTI